MFTDHRTSRYGTGLALLAAIGLCAAPLAAQQATADTARVHVVRPGDTLWDLANQYLGNPYLWTEIYGVNRDAVADPHWIFPRERLLIPGAVPATAGLAGTPVESAAAPARPVGAELVPGAEPVHTVFYHEERYAVTDLPADAVPEQPLVVTQGEYYRAGLLLKDSDVAAVGRVVDMISPTIVPTDSKPQIAPYDRVILKVNAAVQPGDRLHLFRRGRKVKQYGRLYESTGLATVEEVNDDIAIVVIDNLFDQVKLGDIAVPAGDFQPPVGSGPQPATGLQGSVVAFETPHPLAQLHDVAYLDLGRASGVKEGDEFVAFIPTKRESWGLRPEERVARLQVVRVGAVTSAVQVVALQQPALAVGLPVRLVGKMP